MSENLTETSGKEEISFQKILFNKLRMDKSDSKNILATMGGESNEEKMSQKKDQHSELFSFTLG